MYTIYIIENKITNKKYVGKTNDLRKRWTDHINKCNQNKDNFQLYNSMRKHGINNFDITSIYQSNNHDHILSLEKYFIREYDTYKNGYNMTYGGEGTIGRTASKETKNRISKANKGRVAWNKGKTGIYSEESINKMRISSSGKNHPFYGKKLTEEHRLKVSTANCKYTYEITFPDGHKEIINNMKKFCTNNNLDHSTMTKVLKGRYENHKQFKAVKL